MRRRNPLPRRRLERQPTFAQQILRLARALPKDDPAALAARAEIVAEALKLRKFELSNPSPPA